MISIELNSEDMNIPIPDVGESRLAELLRAHPLPTLSDLERGGVLRVPCELGQPVGPDEVEGETYFCGVLTVPMRWDDPESPNIDLHFIVLKASGENPEPDPLVYIAGGPGQSSILTSPAMYQHVRQDRDIVRLDQRGTGLSQRLGHEECLVLALQDEEAEAQVAKLVDFIQRDTDVSAGDTPTSTELDFRAEVHQLCAHQFTKQGIDLNAFTTEASVRDLIALIKGLDYDAFNIHAVSYGTRLTMTLMAMLPEMENAPELRAAILDSPLPPSVHLLSSLARNQHDPALQLLKECEGDEICRQAYPDLKKRLTELLAKLAADPLIVDGQTIESADMIRELRDLSGSRAGYIPRMIAELEDGTADTFFALQGKKIGRGDPEGGSSLDVSDPVQAFIAGALQLLAAGGEFGPPIEFIAALVDILSSQEPLPAFQEYIDRTYEGELHLGLSELMAELSLDDFANSSYVSQFRSDDDGKRTGEPTAEEHTAEQLRQQRLVSLLGLAYYLNLNINCIENYHFESFEDVLGVYRELDFPQLANLGYLEEQSSACAGWPAASGPAELKKPVRSAVPTLILQGAYDNRTPVFMGEQAARELENSRLVIVPQQGHEVWQDANNCVGRICAAFVQDPETELDLSCLEAREPVWSLSGESLLPR